MSLTFLSIAPASLVWNPSDRGHDDDRVLEVHPVAQAVGEMAVLEHLQQDVEDIGMRLLDFVEQHDRVGVSLHFLGELTAFLVAHVPGR